MSGELSRRHLAFGAITTAPNAVSAPASVASSVTEGSRGNDRRGSGGSGGSCSSGGGNKKEEEKDSSSSENYNDKSWRMKMMIFLLLFLN